MARAACALRFAGDNLANTCDSVFEDRHAVKFSLFEMYGVLAGAGDRHVAEFFPHFIRRETNWGRDYGVEITTVAHRAERHQRERIIVNLPNRGQISNLVDAAIEGDRRKALQALCMDPAIQRWDIAGPLLDEMLRATAAHLPQFR